MRNYLKWILLILVSLALASCASVPSSEQPASVPPSPALQKSRNETLSHLKNWQLKGLIAIRSPKDAFSANWQWQQNQRNYTINLVGPLGSHSVQLTGNPNSVLLETSDGKKFTASNPETLLAEQLGWRLPVSNLYYWIRGLPVPGVASAKQFDQANRLTVLIQQGWRIEYLRYSRVNQIDLPSKIILNNASLDVKILINQWEV